VRPLLQLADPSLGNVYAAGDIIDRDIIKNGRAAIEQAQIVAQTTVRQIREKPAGYISITVVGGRY